jgi:short subunit dehydrogenase-like uncharacterized protein
MWVHKMIAKYGEQAKATGAIIVPMSGFDSVPGDLGTFFLASEARKRLGVRLAEATAYVTARGSISGGTIASGLNMARQPDRHISGDAMVLSPLKTPGDDPGPAGAETIAPESVVVPASDFGWPFWVPSFNKYAWFFVMASINTRIVRRSAAIFALHSSKLEGHPQTLPALPAKAFSSGQQGLSAPLAYSTQPFKYTEWSLAGSYMEALGGTIALVLFGLISSLPGGIRFLTWVLPKPGQGPSDERIKSNWFQYFIVGKTEEAVPRTVVARVHGRDGGYGDTSMMLAEAGIALALSSSKKGQSLPAHALGGGFLTPATAFGSALVDRLQSANLRFDWIADESSVARLAATPGPPPPIGTPSML